jgi:transcriptional regulator of arginine metabolism
MSINSQNVSGRRAKAIALIKSGLIHSQTDLVVHLKKSGFRVTQATASRDLEEIGAVRGRDIDGSSVYQIR